jgi:hypothetical protein
MRYQLRLGAGIFMDFLVYMEVTAQASIELLLVAATGEAHRHPVQVHTAAKAKEVQ